MRVARVWARSLLWIAGVRVTVEGLEKIDPIGNYVFCSNHLSYMDTPVVLAISRRSFGSWPRKACSDSLSGHASQAGRAHIPVPLEDPRAAIKTMNTGRRSDPNERRISMLIFPEGGRSEDGVLQPFKDGGAFIAIKARVPLAADGADRHARRAGDGLAPCSTLSARDAADRRSDPDRRTDTPTSAQLTEAAREQIVAMLAKPSAPSRSPFSASAGFTGWAFRSAPASGARQSSLIANIGVLFQKERVHFRGPAQALAA